MPKTIEKKVLPKYFQAILDGKKKFELRLGDFDCQEGDTLKLREWDPNCSDYTGRELEKIISYVIRTKEISFWPEEDIDKYGYQIISFN